MFYLQLQSFNNGGDLTENKIANYIALFSIILFWLIYVFGGYIFLETRLWSQSFQNIDTKIWHKKFFNLSQSRVSQGMGWINMTLRGLCLCKKLNLYRVRYRWKPIIRSVGQMNA